MKRSIVLSIDHLVWFILYNFDIVKGGKFEKIFRNCKKLKEKKGVGTLINYYVHNDQWSKRFSDFFDSRMPKNLWREFLGQKSKYAVITQQYCFDIIGLKNKTNRKIKKTSTFTSWRVANITRLATSIACLCSQFESKALIVGLPSGNAAVFRYHLHTSFSLKHCNVLS